MPFATCFQKRKRRLATFSSPTSADVCPIFVTYKAALHQLCCCAAEALVGDTFPFPIRWRVGTLYNLWLEKIVDFSHSTCWGRTTAANARARELIPQFDNLCIAFVWPWLSLDEPYGPYVPYSLETSYASQIVLAAPTPASNPVDFPATSASPPLSRFLRSALLPPETNRVIYSAYLFFLSPRITRSARLYMAVLPHARRPVLSAISAYPVHLSSSCYRTALPLLAPVRRNAADRFPPLTSLCIHATVATAARCYAAETLWSTRNTTSLFPSSIIVKMQEVVFLLRIASEELNFRTHLRNGRGAEKGHPRRRIRLRLAPMHAPKKNPKHFPHLVFFVQSAAVRLRLSTFTERITPRR